MSIHLEAAFPVSPERVYELLTDGAEFAAATGMPAEIGGGEGAEFSVFGGRILGRQIERIPGKRVVQAWRMPDWALGVYSLVRLTLTPEGAGTKLAVDQDACPEGKSPMFPSWHEHFTAGWPMFYFEPFAKYFAGESERVVSAR